VNTAISDMKMRDTVTRQLEWDARLDADRIGVTANNGAIVLSGHVPGYSDRLEAVRAAERVYGVRAVADELHVKLSPASVRDDSEIAEAVARVLKYNSAIPSSVRAEVLNGHVTLRGDVQWRYQRDEAERAIRHLSGVTSIRNDIPIKPGAETQPDVAHRVREAIERMAHLDARSIRVTTSNGTVRLHGQVHSFADKRTAGLAAASAPGVPDVENDVVVAP
jgi:osmotically-inducible protein OsmY